MTACKLELAEKYKKLGLFFLASWIKEGREVKN
jgi:hypothetical protein